MLAGKRNGGAKGALLPHVLGCLLAVLLAAAPSFPQSGLPGLGEHGLTEEERFEAERQRDRLLETLLSERREFAHARLEGDVGPLPSQAACPAFSAPRPEPRLSLKVPSPSWAPRAFSRPDRPAWATVAPDDASAESIFSSFVSAPIVQARCVNCHVAGGASGFTRLVFVPSAAAGHEATNLGAFQAFLDTVDGGADLILNKIQGAELHGGGVQVAAGSADFANMERFLRALGGETSSGGLSPQTLFDGVTMASPARTLRRAALLFAGRLPTPGEYRSASAGGDAGLRRAVRGMMQGPGFHAFLIRAANDRLLTDRERTNVIGSAEVKFVDLTNRRWELAQEGIANGYAQAPRRYPGYRNHERAVQYGAARAPLELIAHVVENDLPYTEILTADYILANPMAARAYGAATEFDNPEAVTEFRPSEIATYFRRNRSMVVEEDPPGIWRVLNPGDLATDYPHAGVLNTTVFLKRYPTTATNRNRARSRWTYYHFLGFDIEKSVARTQDPDALADTNNPTMHNPACTVCHIPMDPVAGAFQNYGDRGMFRDRNGGRDALPTLYRRPTDGTVSPYQQGDTWFRDMREPGFDDRKAPSADNSLQWLAEQMAADDRFATGAVRFWWPAVMGVELVEPPGDRSDPGFHPALVASAAQALEVEALAEAFRAGFRGGSPYNARDLLAEFVLSPWFRAESVTGDDPVRAAALRDAGVARLLTPEELASKTEALTGYVWGRRMQEPFGRAEPRSRLHDPQGFSGYQLLYGGIDSDGIIERGADINPLMAAVAQSHAVEVACPVVRREFFFWTDGERLLFNGVTPYDTPISDAGGEFDVAADSWDARESLVVAAPLAPGAKTVRLAFTNNLPAGSQDADGNPLDRNLNLDRLVVRSSDEAVVAEVELETLRRRPCGVPSEGFFQLRGNCVVEVPVLISSAGDYRIEVVAHQDRAGDDHARLAVAVEAVDGRAAGETAIRAKLAELHQTFFGVQVAMHSPDVNEAFDLFAEVWGRKRASEGPSFYSSRFHCSDSADHQYFDGLVDDAYVYNDNGASQLQLDRVRDYVRGVGHNDPHHAVRAWVVTLAYLMMDYRYLYF